MRRLIIAALAVLVLAGGGAAAWKFLRPHDAMAEARQLMDKGDARAAQLVLRGLVQAEPERAEAWLRLGQVQTLMGDPIAAEKGFRTARDRGWDAHAIAPLLAQAVVSQGRNEEVLRDYKPDGLEPEQAAGVLVARAAAQMALKQIDEATATIAEAQRLAPKSADTAMAAARMALIRNDRAAGAKHLEETLALEPHRLEALMLQAELRGATGDRAGALASYAAALEQAKATGFGRAEELIRTGRADLLMATGDDAGARADIDAVLKTQPKSPLANFLSARLMARARDWRGADAALAQIGPVLSRLPGGNLLLATVKINLDQPEQAVAAAEQQVALTPNDVTSVKLLARLQLLQKRPDAAAKVLSTAAGVLDPEGLDLLGSAYAAQGDGTRALDSLRQASAKLPDDTRLLGRLAALQMSVGQSDQALKTLDRALDLTTATAPAQVTQAALQNPAMPAAPPPPGGAAPTAAQTAATLVVAALRAGEIDRAVAGLEKLRQAKGDPGQIAMLTGSVKLAQVDLVGARAAFEEADRMEPKIPGARLALTRVLVLQGQTAEAITMLEGLLASDPTEPNVLGALVNLLMQTGQTDKALAAAEAAQRAQPTNPGLTVGLATLYLRTGHPDQTIAVLDAFSKAAGNASSPPPEFLLLHGQAQLAQGQRPAAIQTFRRLLNGQQDNVALRRDLADMLAVDKDFEGARTLLREGLARAPGNPVLVNAAVAVAGSEGGPAAALARAEELARDPANPSSPTLVGDVLMSQGKFAAAATSYQTRLAALPKDDPGVVTLQLRLAEAVRAGGDSTRAATMLRDFQKARPDDVTLAATLSTYDITAKRLPEARTKLEMVLAREPNNPAALNNLAWVYQQQGDLAKARAMAARAYLLAPLPQAADTLGWIMLAQGQLADATALLREAARGQPKDPSINYHLASALARSGQKAEAATLLKALLANPPEGFDEKPQAAKLLAELS